MNGSLRVAAGGDLHCTKGSHGAFQTLFSQIVESADVLGCAEIERPREDAAPDT